MTDLILWTRLKHEARRAGVQAVDHGNGHWQIRGGKLLVNWYPLSKRQTVYVKGDGRDFSFRSGDPALVVKAAMPEGGSPGLPVGAQAEGRVLDAGDYMIGLDAAGARGDFTPEPL